VSLVTSSRFYSRCWRYLSGRSIDLLPFEAPTPEACYDLLAAAKVTLQPVFILSIGHHIFQAISHFPCQVGCLRVLWVDFQALRLASSYILFESLESTALHPHASLPLFSQSHWCFPSCKFHFNSLWFSKRQAIVLCPVVPLSTCFDVTLALAHSISGSLPFLPSLPLASHIAFPLVL
jgi:hypothetical protein